MNRPFEKHLKLLRQYVSPYPGRVSLIMLLILINVGIKIINPQIIRFYLDSVTSVTDLTVIRNAALLFIAMALIQEIIYILNVYLSADLAWLTTNNLRFDLFKHVANLDMTYHNEHKPGEMIERVDGDVNALSNFFSVFSLMIISNILLIIGILTALFLEHIVIGLSFTLLTIFALFLMVKTRLFAIEAWKESRESTSELMGYIEERMGGTEELKANGAEHRVFQQFHELSTDEYNKTNHAVLKSRITTFVTFFTIGMGTTLVYALGVPLVQRGEISVGTLYLFTYYFQLLLDPIFQILRQIQQLQQADASIDRINELLDKKTVLNDTGTIMLDNQPATLEFRDLDFAYKDDDYVLRNINFRIEPEHSLGLVGKTGSGKSTISRLLFRLYEYKNGQILINDTPTTSYALRSLRKNIEMVTQEVELFNATIRDNITFFNPNIDDDQVLEVIKLVGLQAWFAEQKEGLDSKITKVGLSAGQAQLLAFARAFISDPAIVVLDEASSRLDPATEKLIETAMDRLLENRTAIVIAHRLETLEKVDEILILENGQIIEYGKRDELIADPNSKFSQLLEIGLEEVLT